MGEGETMTREGVPKEEWRETKKELRQAKMSRRRSKLIGNKEKKVVLFACTCRRLPAVGPMCL